MPETPKNPEGRKPTYAKLDLVRTRNSEKPLVVLGTDFYPDNEGFTEVVWLWTNVHEPIPDDLDIETMKDAFENEKDNLPKNVRFLPVEVLTKIHHT